MTAKSGCSVSDFSLMWDFIMDINGLFFSLLIVLIGLYYVLYSIEYYKITSCLCFAETTFFLSLFLIFNFFIKDNYSKINLGWIALGIGASLGPILGYVFARFSPKISDFFIGL